MHAFMNPRSVKIITGKLPNFKRSIILNQNCIVQEIEREIYALISHLYGGS